MTDPPQEARQPPPKAHRGPRLGVAAIGFLLLVGTRLAQIVLDAQAMAALVAQVVLVEWGTSRVGVAWSAGSGVQPSAAAVLRRVLPAVLLGLAMVATIVGLGIVTHGVEAESVANVSASVLVLGLLNAAMVSWRDELLLHGLALRVLDRAVGPFGQILACAATSAGAALGRSDANARTVVVAALTGTLFGALWVRDRGAWAPWAANAAFRFGAGSLFAGGIVQTRVASNAWGGGDAGLLGGTVAVLALLPFASAAVVLVVGEIGKTSQEPKTR